MLNTTKEEALSAPTQEIAQSQPDTQPLSVYIPDWAGVKLNGHAVIVAFVKDVEEALVAFRQWKGQNAVILLKYTDGSGVVTAADCKQEKFVANWVG